MKKQDKRQFYRYTLNNYGDSRIPLTTHIGFDAFIRNTNQEFAEEGAPPVILKDAEVIDFASAEDQQPFASREAINEFRTIMLKKQPHVRSVYVSKVQKDDSTSLVKRKDEELLWGEINILGLEMESLRDVLYLKKSAKSGIKKGQDNPYKLKPGEKIISNFVHDQKYYQMLMEVMEARTQNEVVRPIEFPREEEGMAVDLIDYSVGGALIESSAELLKFLLGDACPPDVDDEMDFTADYWEVALKELQKRMIHLTFYPKLHFPTPLSAANPNCPLRSASSPGSCARMSARSATAPSCNTACSSATSPRASHYKKTTPSSGATVAISATTTTSRKPIASSANSTLISKTKA